MKKLKISEEDSGKINSYLSVKTFTWQDIINALDNRYTLNQVQYHVTKYYPDLKKNVKKEYSRGGTKLEFLLKKIFPANKIKAEFHLGEKLRADFIVTDPYNLAFEYDGCQHDTYSAHFHGDRHEFADAQARDRRKDYLCSQRGLSLVRISQLDIDVESLKKLIDQVGYGSGEILEGAHTHAERLQLRNKEQQKEAKLRSAAYQKKQRLKQKELQLNRTVPQDNSYAEQQKERQRLYNREQYQRQKEWMKQNKK